MKLGTKEESKVIIPMVKEKKIISLEIPEDLRKALKKEAFNRDITISALIRDILVKELKVEEKK